MNALTNSKDSRRAPMMAAIAYSMIITGVMACGHQSEHKARPIHDDTPFPLVELDQIREISFQNSDCQSLTAPPSEHDPFLQAVDLMRWKDQERARSPFDISHLRIHGFPLKSKYVSLVTYGDVYRRSCDPKEQLPPICSFKQQLEPGWNKVRQGAPVKICATTTPFESQSVEHIALSVTTALESTGQKISRLLPSLINIRPIHLMIMPRFESYWSPWDQDGKTRTLAAVLSDNLAYFPPNRDTPPIVSVFPKRQSSSSLPHLWESEFISAHEFAHHVERSLGIDEFDKHRSKFRVAASEGFADIIAFASLGASNATLLGVPCLGTDRSPNSAEFYSGQAKQLSSDLLARANESSQALSAFASEQIACVGTLPSSAHGIGAIFAHALLTTSEVTPKYSEKPDLTLAEVAVSWVRHINELETNRHESQDLKLYAEALELTILERFKATDSQIPDQSLRLLQEKMGRIFPTISRGDWFQRK